MSDTEVKAIQRRRGTTAEHKTFKTGLQAEITVNTTNNSVVVSDGKGHAFEAARADLSNVNQLNILQHGILDNSLTNFLITYHYNPEDGSVEVKTKDSSTIISQLSNAFIADKELQNVPQKAITDKGIARDNLKNVQFSALSWDSNSRDRIGGLESNDPSGGGFVYRNFYNVDVQNFNKIPDVSGVGGSGLAWKNLSNISGVSLNTLKVNGICDSRLENVMYADLYGKDEVKTYGVEGSGKFLLKRDMSNVTSVQYTFLDVAGIARDNLYNAKFVESFDREDEKDTADSDGFTGTKRKTNELQIAHKDLGNVDGLILTNTGDSGKFKLMSYDGSNADKEKVFKGSKNFLMNTTFTSKTFGYDDSLELSQFGNSTKQGYSKWIARTLPEYPVENIMYKNADKILFQGVFTQSLRDVGYQFAENKIYFSCDVTSSSSIEVGLFINDEFDQPISDYQTISSIEPNYSRRYVLFDLTNEDIADKVKSASYITLVIRSTNTATLYKPQLELHNVTNWENKSVELENSLNTVRNQHVVELVDVVDSLPEVTEKYVRLKSSYTSDDPDRYFYIRSDTVIADEDLDVVDDQQYIKPNRTIYFYENGLISYYCESSKFQFRIDIQEPIELVKFNEFSLMYLRSENSIYTLVGDKWRILEDPKPYRDTLYYLRKDSLWYMYAMDTSSQKLEELSMSGSSGQSAVLPIFFHIKSDKRMNSAGWVCADNFSELPANVYKGAFEYLKNQVNPIGKIVPSGREVFNDATSGMDSYDSSMWLVDWSDNSCETTNVLMSEGTVEQLKDWVSINGYRIVKDSTNIKEIEIAKDLELKTLDGINYYETFDGLNVIVSETVEESNEVNNVLRNLYENSGWAWFYFLGKSDLLDGQDFFKLPRAKGVEIAGDVHPSKLNNKAGDKYSKNLLEGSEGSVGTLMSTYFYVGTPVIKTEEIQVGKTLEVVNEINSKLRSTTIRGVTSYIDDYKYSLSYSLYDIEYVIGLYSLNISEDITLEAMFEGEELEVSFDLTNIPNDKLVITTGYDYPVIIHHADGTEESSFVRFTNIIDELDVNLNLTDRFSSIIVASAKNVNINIDTSLIQSSELVDIEFNVNVDKRSIVNLEGEEVKYSGNVVIKVDNNVVIENSETTNDDYSRFKVYSIPVNYGNVGLRQYAFKSKRF